MWLRVSVQHDDVIKWKHFPRHLWIHRSLVNSLTKGQWLGALMFSLICAWTSGWLNNRDAGDLKRHQAHYDVSAMGCSGLSAFRKSGSSVRHRVLYHSVSRICYMCCCITPPKWSLLTLYITVQKFHYRVEWYCFQRPLLYFNVYAEPFYCRSVRNTALLWAVV